MFAASVTSMCNRVVPLAFVGDPMAAYSFGPMWQTQHQLGSWVQSGARRVGYGPRSGAAGLTGQQAAILAIPSKRIVSLHSGGKQFTYAPYCNSNTSLKCASAGQSFCDVSV